VLAHLEQLEMHLLGEILVFANLRHCQVGGACRTVAVCAA
jgi:hypothetical protein